MGDCYCQMSMTEMITHINHVAIAWREVHISYTSLKLTFTSHNTGNFSGFIWQYDAITYCCFHVVNLSVRLILRHFGDRFSFSGFLMLPQAALQHIRSKSVFHVRYVWPLVHSTWISCPFGSYIYRSEIYLLFIYFIIVTCIYI